MVGPALKDPPGWTFRDQLLIMGRGLQTVRGASEVLPLQQWQGGGSFIHAEGGGGGGGRMKGFEVVLTWV